MGLVSGVWGTVAHACNDGCNVLLEAIDMCPEVDGFTVVFFGLVQGVCSGWGRRGSHYLTVIRSAGDPFPEMIECACSLLQLDFSLLLRCRVICPLPDAAGACGS